MEGSSAQMATEVDNDFKLLKKYARKCNLQNKHLQRMLIRVVEDLSKCGHKMEIDVENITEPTVDSFLDHWVTFMSRIPAPSHALNEEDPCRINELELQCSNHETTIERLNERIAELELKLPDKAVVHQALAAPTQTDDEQLIPCVDEDTPVKSVRLTASSGVLVTAAENGRRSRCNSIDSSRRESSLLEDVMVAIEETVARDVGDRLPPPYPSNKYQGCATGESAPDLSASPSLPPVNCLIANDLGVVDKVDRHAVALNSSDPEVSQEQETSAPETSLPIVENISKQSPYVEATSVQEPVQANNNNPFDSTDDDERSFSPSDAIEAVGNHGAQARNNESESEDETYLNSKADPFILTEWTLYTESHAVPPYGLKSPVVDHLLLSWTSDQRKIHYLISWIECLASPLPKKFPPGLQIVRVSDTVRDGFLILLLPLIRDISMHEVKAFARLSGYEKNVGAASDSNHKADLDRLYDVRFEVLREDSDTELSPPPNTASTPAPSPPRSIAAHPPNNTSNVTAWKESDTSTGVWHSSLSSLLNPIASFWPVTTAATPPMATSLAPELDETKSKRSMEDETQKYPAVDKETIAAKECKQNGSVAPEGTAQAYEFTTPTVLKSIPLKSGPAEGHARKPKGAPPSGRIAERLATLRANGGKS